jgi:tRNA(Ile)-lysidine synthase
VEDSTNAETDYTRNRLRHTVIPALRETNPAFGENAARCIGLLRQDEAVLSGLAGDFIKDNYRDGALPVNELCALAPPVAARVLQALANGALSFSHISAVLELCSANSPHARADVPGMRISREYDRLIFGGDGEKIISESLLVPGQRLVLEEAGLSVTASLVPSCPEINNSDNTFFFQHDSICGSMFIRPRKEGDSIRLLGRNNTKLLKKLFSENKMNGMGKNLIPVVCDDRGPAAVYGLGMAERCAAKPGDDVVLVRIEELK